MNKLFSLEPVLRWQLGHGKVFKMVVRASCEEEARSIASKDAGDEGGAVWLDASLTTCIEIDVDGPAEVICTDLWSA